MKTVSGRVSWTISINGLFLALWLIVQIANGFGFSEYQPPAELVFLAPAIVAIINLLLRYWRTREPIAR